MGKSYYHSSSSIGPLSEGFNAWWRTKKAAITYIRSLLPSPPPTSSSTLPPSTPISSTTMQDWLKRECKKKDGPAQSTLAPLEQLDSYMNEMVKDEGDLVLHWWACMGNIAYPALAPLVWELMAVCATSAPSERVFFAGRAVVTYKCARLTAESIETLVTVKCWLRGIIPSGMIMSMMRMLTWGSLRMKWYDHYMQGIHHLS